MTQDIPVMLLVVYWLRISRITRTAHHAWNLLAMADKLLIEENPLAMIVSRAQPAAILLFLFIHFFLSALNLFSFFVLLFFLTLIGLGAGGAIKAALSSIASLIATSYSVNYMQNT